ncbi:YwdI family protein [Sporosarcina sp. A2]|uniref:YwdI family protein n=1 Tax=Sporosarcina sp. A2 TaxID=3393449 RepID=UPI003D7959EF
MISTNRVLEELQRQLSRATATSDEAIIRESVAAMQSLCGLILGEPSKQLPSSDEKLKFMTGTSPVAGVSLIGATPTKDSLSLPPQSVLEGHVLAEEDANGGSLFDF